jgi:hypothetical protein
MSRWNSGPMPISKPRFIWVATTTRKRFVTRDSLPSSTVVEREHKTEAQAKGAHGAFQRRNLRWRFRLVESGCASLVEVSEKPRKARESKPKPTKRKLMNDSKIEPTIPIRTAKNGANSKVVRMSPRGCDYPRDATCNITAFGPGSGVWVGSSAAGAPRRAQSVQRRLSNFRSTAWVGKSLI